MQPVCVYQQLAKYATEGHVNRLKFLKRQMFGRAHLDLLRVKVLYAV
jgi:transposase